MDTKTTSRIIQQLNKREIDEMVKVLIFPILEENIHRVEFVKNFIGLQDVLYLEEDSLFFYEHPVFLGIDCKTDIKENESVIDLYADLHENAFVDIDSIQSHLNSFFKDTERKLYVEVGFKENILGNDEVWEIFQDMENQKDKEPFELMVGKYKYPDWYDVKFGEEVIQIEKSIEKIRELNNAVVKKQIDELKTKVDELLIADDFDEIKNVNKMIETLQKQLN